MTSAAREMNCEQIFKKPGVDRWNHISSGTGRTILDLFPQSNMFRNHLRIEFDRCSKWKEKIILIDHRILMDSSIVATDTNAGIFPLIFKMIFDYVLVMPAHSPSN